MPTCRSPLNSILSEKVAADAAEPLGVPVFPAVAYGLTPYFMAYPGTVSLKLATYAALLRDILDSLYATGFRRILIVNGHGGNSPVQPVTHGVDGGPPGRPLPVPRLVARAADLGLRAGDRPRRLARLLDGELSLDAAAGRATARRTEALRAVRPPARPQRRRRARADRDGNYGGDYQKPDADTERLWSVAVEETRALLEGDWA